MTCKVVRVQVSPRALFIVSKWLPAKKHSDDQMRGLAAYQQMKECPGCGQTRFRVIETRRQQDAQRRRYKCDIVDIGKLGTN